MATMRSERRGTRPLLQEEVPTREAIVRVLEQADHISIVDADNRRLAQLVADAVGSARPVERLRLQGPFQREHGFCWVAKLPDSLPPGDQGGSIASPVVLIEGTQALGPGHVLHSDIRKHGRGRYSHWGSRLYFSTSDNSDPNSKGREYTLVWSPSAV